MFVFDILIARQKPLKFKINQYALKGVENEKYSENNNKNKNYFISKISQV